VTNLTPPGVSDATQPYFPGYCEESALCLLTSLAPVARAALRVRDAGAGVAAFVRSGGDCDACGNCGTTRSSSSSSYPGATGTHRFGGSDDVSKTRGVRGFINRFSCLECLAGLLIGNDEKQPAGAHGFSGGRGGGIGVKRTGLVSVCVEYVRGSRFHRRVLGGVVVLAFLAVLLTAVNALGGVLWGDGVQDAREGFGVGGGNYRGGGTVAGAALRWGCTH
jgi:hypothetical protein